MSCAKRNKMYIFGGGVYYSPLDDLYVLEILSAKNLLYTQLRSAKSKIASASLTFLGSNRLIELGGRRKAVEDKCLVYNIQRDVWMRSSSYMYHQALSWGGKLLRVGGVHPKSLFEVLSYEVHVSKNWWES